MVVGGAANAFANTDGATPRVWSEYQGVALAFRIAQNSGCPVTLQKDYAWLKQRHSGRLERLKPFFGSGQPSLADRSPVPPPDPIHSVEHFASRLRCILDAYAKLPRRIKGTADMIRELTLLRTIREEVGTVLGSAAVQCILLPRSRDPSRSFADKALGSTPNLCRRHRVRPLPH